MELEEYNKKIEAGEVKIIEEEKIEKDPEPFIPGQPVEIEQYVPFLEKLKRVLRHITVVPTDTPQGFLSQFRFYLSGGVYRVYININNVWNKVFDSAWAFLTATQLTDLTDAGDSALHYHSADRIAIGFTSRARASLGSNQTVTTATETKVELDTEQYDGDEEFDKDTDYRFTAVSAGYYFVSGVLFWTTVADGVVTRVMIYRNGTQYCMHAQRTGGAGFTSNFVSDVVYLAAGQYIELYVIQNAVGNLILEAGASKTCLAIHRLS